MMNNDEKIRYSRNISLPEIGQLGQEKLGNARVLVVGAGGLGSPILLYLAASGVGAGDGGLLGICDSDKVDLSNLQRQIIFETGDVDDLKNESAKAAILDLNPHINIKLHGELSTENAALIVADYDIVADATDNFEARFLLNEICHNLKKPLVSAAIHRFEGHISTYKSYLENRPCYRCVFPEIPPADIMPSCSESGVLGAVGGVLGSIQAIEIVKEIIGLENLLGNLLVIDFLTYNFRKLKIHKDINCVICTKKIL